MLRLRDLNADGRLLSFAQLRDACERQARQEALDVLADLEGQHLLQLSSSSPSQQGQPAAGAVPVSVE